MTFADFHFNAFWAVAIIAAFVLYMLSAESVVRGCLHVWDRRRKLDRSPIGAWLVTVAPIWFGIWMYLK